MNRYLIHSYVDPDFQEIDSNSSNDEDNESDDEEESDMNQDTKRKRKSGKLQGKKKVKMGRDDVEALRKAVFPTSSIRGNNEVETFQTGK